MVQYHTGLFCFRRDRDPKQCPVCHVSVIKLFRHMKNVHGWKNESAKGVVSQFGLRKKYTKKKQEVKDKKQTQKITTQRKPRMCPYADCMQVVIGLGEHLQRTHHLQPSQLYYQMLESAKEYSRDVIPSSVIKSPRKDLV